ncbi:MAG: hypothetical protein Tsb0013_02920 [Phycisphaerales bacterium]
MSWSLEWTAVADHCRVVKIREPKRTCFSRTRVPDAAFTPSRHHRQTQFEDGRPGASLAA